MTNVVKMRPNKPLTQEEELQESWAQYERDMTALGIDIHAMPDDEDNDEE